MSMCYPISSIPVTCETIEATGVSVNTSPITWYGFPQEIVDWMEAILKPYGYESDSDELPDVESFLLDVEYSFRGEGRTFPWAIIFYPEEYPLGGHLLSIRPNRDIRFFCYSLMHRQVFESFDPAIDGPPPLSMVYVYSKPSLMRAAASNSPLLNEGWLALADKSENNHWAVIANPLEPTWVKSMSKQSDDLFFELMGISRA